MKRSTLHNSGSNPARSAGLQKLIDGVHKFQIEHFEENKLLFERLSRGQKPQVLMITCADSRIDPNLITASQPGDLFIMRNVANLVPQFHPNAQTEAGAVIEYAISVLGVTEIIVMGHSDCGGIKAVLHPEKLTTLPAVSTWLNHAATAATVTPATPATRTCRSCCDESQQLLETTNNNIVLQLKNLATHPSVAAAMAYGKLHIHGWNYKIENGSIRYFDQDRKHWCQL
jgi:carbonic anhydrase